MPHAAAAMRDASEGWRTRRAAKDGSGETRGFLHDPGAHYHSPSSCLPLVSKAPSRVGVYASQGGRMESGNFALMRESCIAVSFLSATRGARSVADGASQVARH